MTLRDYVVSRLAALLDAQSVVVWFDPGRVFADLAIALAADSAALPHCTVVLEDGSGLRARRAAEAVYAELYPPEPPGARGNRLLLYRPCRRPVRDDQRLLDPLEVFAVVGATFGDRDAESVHALACRALPEHQGAIDRLFAQGTPSLTQIDNLAHGSHRAALREALGAEAAVDVAAALLCRPEPRARLEATVGAKAELQEALTAEFGFRPPANVSATATLLDHLARYVLVSELLFDLPTDEPPPAGLASVAHAAPEHRPRIFALCERMRADARLQPGYIERALAVEQQLGVAAELAGRVALGERDTFSCEERGHAAAVVRLAHAGDLDAAAAVIAGRAGSIWRTHEDRAVLWKLAERCVDFLRAARAVEQALPGATTTVAAWVQGYAKAGGFWRLDHGQRLFEQAETEAAHDEPVEALIVLCRARYRAVAQQMQERFLAAVARDGWPPEGVPRHAQTFALAVQPELDGGRRVAYFFVDALRYEMGEGLATELADLGETRVTPLAGTLPATTPCGMAALLPGAESAYRLETIGGEAVPTIRGKPLPGSQARMDYLRGIFGDRFAEAPLDDVLTMPEKKLASVTQGKALYVVRSQEIDGIGENLSGYLARRLMGGVPGDLRRATARLANLGFQSFVYVGDHGHILLPEMLHGDLVAKPAGQWLKEKRRSLLGSRQSGTAGVRLFSAAHLGIPTDAPDFAVPPGFCVFTAGVTYFHEGISLQECVIPLVVLHRSGAAGSDVVARVTLSYRAPRFTSHIISIKAMADATLDTAMGDTGVEVNITAFDGATQKAKPVGEAADCDARNPETRLVTLVPGQETSVPVRIDDDFGGDAVEIRATDPLTGKTLGTLRLKNATQE